MKRRRRLNTQTIIKKKTTPTGIHKPLKEGSSFNKVFKIFIWLIFIGLLAYLGYQYGRPLLKQKLPALEQITQSKKTAAEEKTETPALPLESNNESPTENSPEPETILPSIQVEILNGCGEQGIAKTLAQKLVAFNYDVVNTGNYLKKGKPFFEVPKTRIIDRVGTEKTNEKVLQLAQQLGIPEKNVESIPIPNPIADITIIVGQDFNTLKIFKGNKK